MKIVYRRKRNELDMLIRQGRIADLHMLAALVLAALAGIFIAAVLFMGAAS